MILVIMEPRDRQDHRALSEDKVCLGLKETQDQRGHWEVKANLVRRVNVDQRVMKEWREIRVLPVPLALRVLLEVT